MYRKMLLAVVVVSTAIPIVAQVAPEAKVRSIPLTVGVGYSNYYTDWSGRLSGPSLWINWSIDQGPSYLKGLGVEAEARDLNYQRNGAVPNLRMDTASGGVIYTWGHFRNFDPYVKYLIGYGSIDFTIAGSPSYKHDTRTVYAPGGGLDYRVFRGLLVRGNYEYQFWPDLIHGHALNPQGFTLGVAYDMGDHRGR